MADFKVDIEKTIKASQDILDIAKKLNAINKELDAVKVGGVLESQSSVQIEKTLMDIFHSVSDEAVKMKSMGDALELIAKKYRETEKIILDGKPKYKPAGTEAAVTLAKGTDKRNLWNKFWDWITRKEPDAYDTTTLEQEKAADEAMKKELWKVLQDEKYSRDSWDNASVEERKKILQDYMDEVIKIYGLQDVKTKIYWDDKLTYTENSITWGHYTHWSHKVTLNESALKDSVGNWDSYELLGTIAHELRHAYQHEAVDHPTDYKVSQETIDKWDKNFKNYIGSGDYTRYRNQPVEVDARNFEVSRYDRM